MIRGGKEGYERLRLLARDRWPDTAALFERAGLSPGMRCIDLGCGGGEVTFEIARLVAPGGSVTGVDMDAIKLDLARRAAAERGLGNVEFRLLNVRDWDESGAYDAVYCRFLLQHLSQPVDLLRRIWAGVRPGGVLIVEDADFDGWCWTPAQRRLRLLLAHLQPGTAAARRGSRGRAQTVCVVPGRRHSRPSGGPSPAAPSRGRGKDAAMVNARSVHRSDRVGAPCLQR